jgi:hypothetical protein
MLIFVDGFDHYAATSESSANVATYLQAAGYSVSNVSSNTVNIADGQDVGSTGVKLTIGAGANNPPSFQKTFNTAASLVVFGFSFRGAGSRQRVARINGAVDLNWDANTGKLVIGTTQGADVIIMNAFWFIEVEVDKGDGKVRVYANNALQLEVDLPAGAITTAHTIQWGPSGTSVTAATIEIDDFYVVDNSGGTNNARLGPIQIATRAPTADVTTEWTAVGSAGTHASIAAQLSPNASGAPYLQANVEGKRDRFSSNTVLPNDNQIFAVQQVAYSRKGDLDNRNLGITIQTPGGETEVAVPLTTTYAYRTAVFEKAPGNVDWNQVRVEGSVMGIVAR